MRELIIDVVRLLVDHPDQVSVAEHVNGITTLIEIDAGDQAGMVIGKKGKTVNGLRAVLEAIAGREGRRVTVDVLDGR